MIVLEQSSLDHKALLEIFGKLIRYSSKIQNIYIQKVHNILNDPGAYNRRQDWCFYSINTSYKLHGLDDMNSFFFWQQSGDVIIKEE